MSGKRIGELFPVGGPVRPPLVIGRDDDIRRIEQRLREGLHTMLIGPRRIGKTTVCEAVCERRKHDGSLVIDIEVPERSDSAAFLQEMVDRCDRVARTASRRRLIRSALPLVERVLADRGIPLDLSELSRDPGALPARTILSLPLEIARGTGRGVVLFLDELQRVLDYADGAEVLTDLVDLYGTAEGIVVLVDGSDERALTGLLGEPIHFGKLCDRQTLDPRILPLDVWRAALADRFHAACIAIDPAALTLLLEYGSGRPYATMAAARYAALNARKLAEDGAEAELGEFEAQMGIDEARRHLEDDGAAS